MNKILKYIILFFLLVMLIFMIVMISVYGNLGKGGYNPGYSYINNTVEVDGLNITITNVEYYDDSTTVYITIENTTENEKEVNIFVTKDSKGNTINREILINNILIDNLNTKTVKPKTISYAVVNIPYYFKLDGGFQSPIEICSISFFLHTEEDWLNYK